MIVNSFSDDDIYTVPITTQRQTNARMNMSSSIFNLGQWEPSLFYVFLREFIRNRKEPVLPLAVFLSVTYLFIFIFVSSLCLIYHLNCTSYSLETSVSIWSRLRDIQGSIKQLCKFSLKTELFLGWKNCSWIRLGSRYPDLGTCYWGKVKLKLFVCQQKPNQIQSNLFHPWIICMILHKSYLQ